MANDPTTKAACLYLLSRGLCTIAEASHLAGRSRQIVRHWAKDLPPARPAYLARHWKRALAKGGFKS